MCLIGWSQAEAVVLSKGHTLVGLHSLSLSLSLALSRVHSRFTTFHVVRHLPARLSVLSGKLLFVEAMSVGNSADSRARERGSPNGSLIVCLRSGEPKGFTGNPLLREGNGAIQCASLPYARVGLQQPAICNLQCERTKCQEQKAVRSPGWAPLPLSSPLIQESIERQPWVAVRGERDQE